MCIRDRSGIRGGDAIPAQGMDVRTEKPRVVEAFATDRLPTLRAEDFLVKLEIPDDLEWLTLRVVIETRQSCMYAVAALRLVRRLDEVGTCPDTDYVTRMW